MKKTIDLGNQVIKISLSRDRYFQEGKVRVRNKTTGERLEVEFHACYSGVDINARRFPAGWDGRTKLTILNADQASEAIGDINEEIGDLWDSAIAEAMAVEFDIDPEWRAVMDEYHYRWPHLEY